MLHIYWKETKFEFLNLLRLPSYSLSTILFPVLFYAFFGLMMPSSSRVGGTGFAQYLLATYGACGIMSATLFALGVGVASERGLGWLTVKRASPMPLAAWFVAKAAAAVAFGAVVLILLFSMGAGLGGVTMPSSRWAQLAGVLLLGSIPFSMLGLAIGMLAKPTAASGIVNLIFLPMCFLSGLWLPIAFLPKGIKAAAVFLPGFHLGQLGLLSLGAKVSGDVFQHVAVLGVYSVLFALAAWLGYRREQERMFG